MAELYERRQVTAKRPHKCHLCGDVIPPETVYIREKWRDDGFHEVKRHIHCDALLDEYLSDYYCRGYEYTDDEVWEWIRDRCLDLCGFDAREECERNPFSCARMLDGISNVNSRRAAEESLRSCEV